MSDLRKKTTTDFNSMEEANDDTSNRVNEMAINSKANDSIEYLTMRTTLRFD